MSRVRSKDGTPIAYERAGSGEPLILVDGAVVGSNGQRPPDHVAMLDQLTAAGRRGEAHDVKPQALAPVPHEYFAA